MKTTTAKRILALVSVILVLVLAMSGCATSTSTSTATDASTGTTSAWSMIPMLVIMVAILYFFMLRPEKKRKKEAEDLRNSLTVGDKIVTIGGMTGKIVSVSSDDIVFETGEDRVRIQVKKWAVSRKEGKDSKENKDGK